MEKVNCSANDQQKNMAKSKQRAPSASPQEKSAPPTPRSDAHRQDDEENERASPVKLEDHHLDSPHHDDAMREEASDHSSVPVLSLDVACPLCVSKRVTQPVVLHGYKDDKDGQHHVCIACEACARRWLETTEEPSANGSSKPAAAIICPRCSHETDIEKSSDFVSLREYEELVERQHNTRSGPKKGSLTNLVAPTPTVLIDNLQTALAPPTSADKDVELCVMCDKEPAMSECTTCNCVLCPHCVERTHKGPRMQAHVITAIGSIKRCEKHPEMSKTIYCFECGEDICSRCFFAGHKLHQANDMLELATESIDKCLEGMQALDALHSGSGVAVGEDASSFVDEIRSVKEDHGRMESQIVDAFQSLREALDAREQQLKQTLSEFFHNKLHVLQGRSRLLRSTTDQVEALRSALNEAKPTIANVNTMMYTALFQPRIEALRAQLSKAVGGEGPGAAASLKDIMDPIKEVRFVITPAEHNNVLTLLQSTGAVELPRARPASSKLPESSSKRPLPQQQEARAAAPLHAHNSATSNWKATSLNISTQLPDVSSSRGSGGVAVPALPTNISKRRQHLTLSEEADAGEPARKSTDRVTNATTTLSGLSSHFLQKRPIQPPVAQQPSAPIAFGKKGSPSESKPPAAEDRTAPPARSNMKFELKL